VKCPGDRFGVSSVAMLLSKKVNKLVGDGWVHLPDVVSLLEELMNEKPPITGIRLDGDLGLLRVG